MSNHTNRHDELRALLERLNLGGMAAVFADLALKAAKESLSHEAYLWELGKYEEELRTQRRTARLLRASALPPDKTFRTFDLKRLKASLQLQIERLKSGSFLHSATNVVAAGLPGVGKSHVAAALGYELILQGHPVLWTPTSNLVQRLLAAKRDLRLSREIKRLARGLDQNGALVYAPYGKGTYIYTGIAFFRQLPEGVPGAYRLFVNLLSASRAAH